MSIANITDPNDGRNRRKVMFRSDDMKFSDLDESGTEDDDDDVDEIGDIVSAIEDNNDSDSEWSDFEEETMGKKNEIDKSRFYGQSFGKENEIRKKIANELAKLDKINQQSNIRILNENEEDNSDDSLEYDEDSDVEDNSENEKDFNESDENDILSEIDDDHVNGLIDKVSINDLKETDIDTTINWKKNLAQKATNAYYDRQNSVANLWKLVYGKFILLIKIDFLNINNS